MSYQPTKQEQQLIDGWIKELTEMGYTYDEMINIFRIAREKREMMYSKNYISKHYKPIP